MNDDLLDEIYDDFISILTEEIDNEILCEIMVNQGWHRVKMSAAVSLEEFDNIDKWVKENTVGKYRGLGINWVFENLNDATLFTMRWI